MQNSNKEELYVILHVLTSISSTTNTIYTVFIRED